ncbi:MAG TPA: DNA-directed RNA polymerase subunit N [Nitrososphaerales archaeon]|nr:DNA-directed RNA polymerase subunit N [Nitrososphaerales archaeon]
MIIPVRCFSCGAVVADKLETLESRTSNGESPADILNDLGVTRYCCRRMLLSNSNVIDQIIQYHENLHDKNKRMEFEFS